VSEAAAATHPPETVILLGTDTPIGLAVVRDLGRHGYRTIGIGRRANALAAASRHCFRHYPRADGEAGLIAQILALAEEHQARWMLTVGESDLLLLNRHRAELETRLQVLAPGNELLMQVLDKATCQQHAEAVGIAVPRTQRFASLADARAAAPGLHYPVVLKWSDPHVVAAALEAAGLPLVKTGYAHDAADLLAQLAAYEAVGTFPLVQEYCPGHGLGQMFLVRDGDVLLEFQHERIHEWPPEGGASTLCRSVPLASHGEARAQARALLRRLHWTGVAMVEYRYDPRSRRYVFMEINGRFWGSLPLAVAAGLPFAAGLVAHCGNPDSRDAQSALAESAPAENAALRVALPRDYPVLTACYWIPESKRLLRVLFQRRRIQDPFFRPDPLRSLLSYLAFPLRPSGRWFIFQLSDPKPFFSDLTGVFRKLLRRS
jgi:predicted ATP-grasp superfamily ATP-dependent carboligase